MRRLSILLALLLALLTTGAAMAATELKPDKDLEIIARVTANILGREHYRREALNDELSSQLFDEYFRILDPTRFYLSQEDVAIFEPQRLKLDDQLLQGDLSFPFAVYQVLLKKVAAYRDFSQETLKAGLRFDTDEEMVLDRDKQPWLPERELRDTWIRRLKNDVLVIRLMERAAEAERQEAKDKPQAETPANPPAAASPWGQKSPEQRVADRTVRYLQLLSENDPGDILELYLTSLATVYDHHSSYMSPASVDDFNIQMSLSLAGIGAVLKSEDGYTQIVKVVDGGPAAMDGRLKAEDRIIAVAQGAEEPVDIIDMPLKKVVQKIRGTVGSEVTLTVLPAKQGIAAIPTTIKLIRDEVKLAEQEAKGEVRELPRADGTTARVGIIDLPSFYVDFEAAYQGKKDYKSSTRDLHRLLTEFQQDKPLDGLVLDLRRNGGGGLLEAIQLTGLFIPKGPVVQVHSANGRIEVKNDDDPAVAYGGPLVVMVSRLSASAAEIFAGAIQDYGRGILVGDSHTHGKGTVQTVLELDPILRHYGLRRKAGSAKVTTAMFHRINGDSTQLRGVVPDIVFPSYTDLMEIGEKNLDHPLPWAQIPPATYTPDATLAGRIEDLRARSIARRADSPAFQALQERLDVYRRFRDRKTISLNEEQRWQSYLDEKRMLDDQLRMIRIDENGEDLPGTDKNQEDIILDESLAILIDFLSPPAAAAPTS
jgi:carboxyl-terminal processing protease